MIRKKFLFIIFIGLMSQSGIAVSLATTLSPPNGKNNEKEGFSGSIGGQTNQLVNNFEKTTNAEYADDIGDVVGNKYYGELDLNYTHKSEGFLGVFDFKSRINDESSTMFSVPEAKLVYGLETSKLTVGRSILEWSPVDRVWGLGKVNNRINFDGFDPGQEGLIGAFYDKKFSNGFTMGFFGSVLYVPELNPGAEIDKDKGTVTCKNPWCSAPSPSADINDNGQQTPIYYNVNYPEIADTVFRYSGGINLGYETDNLRVDGFYLRKPENSVSIAAEIKYETDLDRVFVDVTPQFYYHDIFGANIKSNFGSVDLYASAIQIKPNDFPDGNQPYIEYTGIKPRKLKEDYVGLGGIYEGGSTFFKKLHLGYIARTSEFDKENDILVEYPRWNQAVVMSGEFNLTKDWLTVIDYKYDTLSQDRILTFKSSYMLAQAVELSLGVNMIGTNGKGESYWSDFENNDAVFSSLKYVF